MSDKVERENGMIENWLWMHVFDYSNVLIMRKRDVQRSKECLPQG